MDAFVPYGGLHAVALAVCLPAIAAPALIGRALEPHGEMILRRTLAALAACYWLAYTTWWNWHGLDLRTGLPLQVCDFNGLIAPLALLSGWRFVRATLYFWTAALTLQAFIQPALTAGPAALVFWAFWTAHTLIAACAIYDIVVLGYRPCWNDLGRALIVQPACSACRARGADQSPARRQLRLSRQSGGRERDSTVRLRLGTLAAARNDPGCARAARLRRRAAALAYPSPVAKARTTRHPQQRARNRSDLKRRRSRIGVWHRVRSRRRDLGAYCAITFAILRLLGLTITSFF